jgi:plasmid stabilization system protein ParE
MPQVKYARGAVSDLERLHNFLRQKSPTAASRAAEAITNAIGILAEYPNFGRVAEDMPEAFRELLIPFGASGYVAMYRVEREAVVVLAIRHQKEAGFS